MQVSVDVDCCLTVAVESGSGSAGGSCCGSVNVWTNDNHRSLALEMHVISRATLETNVGTTIIARLRGRCCFSQAQLWGQFSEQPRQMLRPSRVRTN